MNIGMLTTWNSKCGIFEYSRNLIKHFDDRVVVFSNFGYQYGKTKMFKNVTDCFGVTWWNEPAVFDVTKILEEVDSNGIKVFHVQYHSSLYKHPEFDSLMKLLIGRGVKLVITLHDSSRHPSTNLHLFDDIIYHKEGIFHEKVLGNKYLLPYPIQSLIPKVFSFGMGRNDYDLISRVCEKLGIAFLGHDSKKDGWLEEHVLFAKMSVADAIVLWYNDVSPLVGASAAARTALASRRPVIVNSVDWFDDLDEDCYRFAYNEIELEDTLRDVLLLDHIRNRSFEELAKKHNHIYGGTYVPTV